MFRTTHPATAATADAFYTLHSDLLDPVAKFMDPKDLAGVSPAHRDAARFAAAALALSALQQDLTRARSVLDGARVPIASMTNYMLKRVVQTVVNLHGTSDWFIWRLPATADHMACSIAWNLRARLVQVQLDIQPDTSVCIVGTPEHLASDDRLLGDGVLGADLLRRIILKTSRVLEQVLALPLPIDIPGHHAIHWISANAAINWASHIVLAIQEGGIAWDQPTEQTAYRVIPYARILSVNPPEQTFDILRRGAPYFGIDIVPVHMRNRTVWHTNPSGGLMVARYFIRN